MKKKIETNFFCKSNHWPRRINKIRKIVQDIISFDNCGFKKKNYYFLNLIFVDDKRIKKINHMYRKINKSTDVLSFPLKNKNYIGDIAISFEIINKRSKKTNFFLELDKMWIHGYFHLIGYDHKKIKEFKKMNKKENLVLNYLHKKI